MQPLIALAHHVKGVDPANGVSEGPIALLVPEAVALARIGVIDDESVHQVGSKELKQGRGEEMTAAAFVQKMLSYIHNSGASEEKIPRVCFSPTSRHGSDEKPRYVNS